MSDFAALLLDARKRAGLSQAELAVAAGLTPSYLCTIEKRKKPPPSDDVCRRLAAVLGVPEARLLEVAHLERAPDALRKRLRALDRSLRRERKSSLRVLRSLLSPFLFAGPPGYAESALATLGISRSRRRRIREVLEAVGRRRHDLEQEVSSLIDDLPERERTALLESLPQLLAEQARRTGEPDAAESGTPGRAAAGPGPAGPTSLSYDLPAPVAEGGEASTGSVLLDVDERMADGFDSPAPGDRVVVDGAATPEDGDLVVLRGADGPRLRRFQRIGPLVRLSTDRTPRPVPADDAVPGTVDRSAADPARFPSGDLLDATELHALWRAVGAGVVTEIRRPLPAATRRRPARRTAPRPNAED